MTLSQNSIAPDKAAKRDERFSCSSRGLNNLGLYTIESMQSSKLGTSNGGTQQTTRRKMVASYEKRLATMIRKNLSPKIWTSSLSLNK